LISTLDPTINVFKAIDVGFAYLLSFDDKSSITLTTIALSVIIVEGY
jgi:hypothetical protein